MMKPAFLVGHHTANWAKARGISVHYAPKSISTNTLARDGFITDAGTLKLYVTDEQEGGRGRNSNTWSSPPAGTSLLSSWSFALSQSPQPVLSPLVGLAVYNAARMIWPQIEWSLKAPNDLYIGVKKVAGLLIETQEAGAHRRVVIGLGLNVFASPVDITTSTHISSHTPLPLSEDLWWKFLAKLQANFQTALVKGVVPFLSIDDREQLRVALNLNPRLDLGKVTKVVSVEADGSLLTTAGLIQWSDL